MKIVSGKRRINQIKKLFPYLVILNFSNIYEINVLRKVENNIYRCCLMTISFTKHKISITYNIFDHYERIDFKSNEFYKVLQLIDVQTSDIPKKFEDIYKNKHSQRWRHQV